MYKTEPMIELKETMARGEILQWRCQPGWQGSGENYLSRPTYRNPPVRLMYDSNVYHRPVVPNFRGNRPQDHQAASRMFSSPLFKN